MGLELRYVVDPAGDPNLPGVTHVNGLEQALADDDVQAVIVAAPNDQHVPLALAAVGAGRHVLLEKPVALTVAELDPLVAAATAQRLCRDAQPPHALLRPTGRSPRGRRRRGSIGGPLAARVERRDMLTRTKPWLQQRGSVGGHALPVDLPRVRSAALAAGRRRGDLVPLRCAQDRRGAARLSTIWWSRSCASRRGAVAQVWSCMTDPMMAYRGSGHGGSGHGRVRPLRRHCSLVSPRWGAGEQTLAAGRSVVTDRVGPDRRHRRRRGRGAARAARRLPRRVSRSSSRR